MNETLHLKLFGMLQEKIGAEIELNELVSNVSELRAMLEKKYIYMNGINYLVAINKTIATDETMITNDSEIAILPPFSGG